MAGQVHFRSEPFATFGTLVRFFSSVYTLVAGQMTTLSKLLSTFATLVWLFACMFTFMTGQVPFPREPFATFGTLVRLLDVLDIRFRCRYKTNLNAVRVGIDFTFDVLVCRFRC